MLIKRLLLVVISLTVGFFITWGIIEFIGSNLPLYGPYYTTFTTLAIASAIAIWLDKFMGTELLSK